MEFNETSLARCRYSWFWRLWNNGRRIAVVSGDESDNSFFRSSSYTFSTGVMTLVKRMTEALDTGKIVVGVYLDIRKAFDSISTSILLDKLYKIRICGNLYCLLQSYLSTRTQYTVFYKCNSSTQSIEYGAPQGSILGLFLFIFFL